MGVGNLVALKKWPLGGQKIDEIISPIIRGKAGLRCRIDSNETDGDNIRPTQTKTAPDAVADPLSSGGQGDRVGWSDRKEGREKTTYSTFHQGKKKEERGGGGGWGVI